MTKETSRSGPSGKHKPGRYLLSLRADQRKRWEREARRRGLTLAAWIRECCDNCAEWSAAGAAR